MSLNHALAIRWDRGAESNMSAAAIRAAITAAQQGDAEAQEWCKRLHAAVERRIGDEA